MMVKYGEVSEGKSHQIPDTGGISLIFDGEIPIFEVASNFKLKFALGPDYAWRLAASSSASAASYSACLPDGEVRGGELKVL